MCKINKKFFVVSSAILIFIFVMTCYLVKHGKKVKLKTSQQAHHNLVNLLKIYNAYDNNGPINLVRQGKDYDGGYVVPVKAIELADVLLGYGIDTDNSFEDQFSLTYNKPSYGFDCGIDHIDSKSSLFTFVNQCIGTDSTLYNKNSSSKKITSFGKQLDYLGIKGKKIFIKMDIEGAEYEAFRGISNYYKDITGIALEIHIDKKNIKKAIHLLNNLNQHFVLLHLHGNNCCLYPGISANNIIGVMPHVIELTYINKNLVKEYHFSYNQAHPTSIDMPNIKELPDAEFEIL